MCLFQMSFLWCCITFELLLKLTKAAKSSPKFCFRDSDPYQITSENRATKPFTQTMINVFLPSFVENSKVQAQNWY